MNFKEIVASRDGFGLIQVLVALGLLGILMFAMMSMLANFNKEGALIKSKVGFTNLASDMRTVLGTGDLCTQVLAGIQIDPVILSDKQKQQQLGTAGGLNMPSFPVFKDNSDFISYDSHLHKIYFTNAIGGGNAPTPGHTYVLMDLMISGGSLMKNVDASSTREFKDIVAAKLRLELDAFARVAKCGVGPSEVPPNPSPSPSPTATPAKPANCAYAIFKDRPWIRRSINCKNSYKNITTATYDFIYERGGELFYRDSQTSDPLVIRFNSSSGAFVSKQGDSSSALGADCMKNLKEIVENDLNSCE